MTQAKALRVVYREILPGDIRKIREKSNDANTGGGARDLRFNHKAFHPMFGKMFTQRKEVKRKRASVLTEVTIYEAELEYAPNKTTKISYEPPTPSRPAEGRIPQISKLPPFENIPETPDDKVFALIVQDRSDKIHIHFALESELPDKWNSQISKLILQCDSAASDRVATQGYYDLLTGKKYCHDS